MRTLKCFVSLAVLMLFSEGNSSQCFNDNCVFKKVGDACKKYNADIFKEMPLSDEKQKAIVKWHNDRRREVAKGLVKQKTTGKLQPKAANMMKMYWDDELAESAQRLANQCLRLTHDCYKCRQDTFERFPSVGQNLYWQGDVSNDTFTKGRENWWFEEQEKFDPALVTNFAHKWEYSHYSQLVWWNTRAIGCGASIYDVDGIWNDHLFVCDYGPWGNVVSQPVYEIGEPCSKCPTGTVCEDGLCALPQNFDVYGDFSTDKVNLPYPALPKVTVTIVD